MKNLIKKLEIIGLKYMTNVIFFMIASIWILKFFCILDIEYSLTSTGAIFAFWYGYKRYERDKELQIIKDFNLLEGDGIDFKKWMMIYNLYKKGYISSELYKMYESEQDNLLFRKIVDYSEGGDPNWVEYIIENIDNSSNFYRYLHDKFLHYKDHHNNEIKEICKKIYTNIGAHIL